MGNKNTIINQDGYRLIRDPEHYLARKDGYVYEHRLIASEALGKPIPKKSIVHHIDGDRLNNKNNNLVICEDRGYHKLIHQRIEAKKESGFAHYKKCWVCKEWGPPEDMSLAGINKYPHPTIYHKKCLRERTAKIREKHGDIYYKYVKKIKREVIS